MNDELKVKNISINDVSFEDLGKELENLGEDELISVNFLNTTDNEELNNAKNN